MAASDHVVELEEEIRSKMTIEEEEEDGLVFEGETGDDIEDLDVSKCLVGRFITEKQINFLAMQSAMSDLWKPGRGVFCKELESNLYIFQFFHEIDFKRIVEGGPWTYENAMLVWKQLKEGEDPRRIPLTHAEFWVHVSGLKPGSRVSKVCEAVGNYLGLYIPSEAEKFEGEKGKEYLRVRVSVDITKPLKSKMKVKKPGGDYVWHDLTYERLPSFCFICGIIGHGERFCEVLYNNPKLAENKPYGPWLRAANRRVNYVPTSKWLRNSKGERLGGEEEVGGGGRKPERSGGSQNPRFPEKSAALIGCSNSNTVIQFGNKNLGGQLRGVIKKADLQVDQIKPMEADFQGEEDQGVVIVEAKRKRLDFQNSNEGGESQTREDVAGDAVIKSNWAETLNGPSVGSGFQAHREQ